MPCLLFLVALQGAQKKGAQNATGVFKDDVQAEDEQLGGLVRVLSLLFVMCPKRLITFLV